MSGSENGISRLLSAAVVNRRFQDTLLTDPERALAQGYLGERFELDPEEKALILGIRAESLADFARQLRSRQALQAINGCGAWVPTRKTALVLDKQ